MVLGQLDTYRQKNEAGAPFYSIFKTNSEWIKDLKLEAIKLSEENIGVNLLDRRFGNGFLEMT